MSSGTNCSLSPLSESNLGLVQDGLYSGKITNRLQQIQVILLFCNDICEDDSWLVLFPLIASPIRMSQSLNFQPPCVIFFGTSVFVFIKAGPNSIGVFPISREFDAKDRTKSGC